jgi:hypothetical protein
MKVPGVKQPTIREVPVSAINFIIARWSSIPEG